VIFPYQVVQKKTVSLPPKEGGGNNSEGRWIMHAPSHKAWWRNTDVPICKSQH